MELFEKLNAFAKTAADKTNELVEDTRLKAQILHDENPSGNWRPRSALTITKNSQPDKR